MPKVEQYGLPKVAGAIPNQVRASAPQLQDTTAPLVQGMRNLAKGFEIHQDRVDTNDAEEALVGFEREKNEYLFNPETGYYNSNGKNAFDGRGEANKHYNEIYKKYYDGLNQGAKDKARKAFDSHLTSDTAKMDIHAAKGFDAYETDTVKQRIESSKENSAYTYMDDAAVKQQMDVGIASVRELAGKNGVEPKEYVEGYIRENLTGMIGAALDHEDIAGAKSILSKYGDNLNSEGGKQALESIINKKEQQLDNKNIAEIANTNATSIMSEAGGDMVKAMELTKDIEPKFQAATRREVMAQFDANTKAVAYQNKQTIDDINKFIANGGTYEQYASLYPDKVEGLTKSSVSTAKSGSKTVTYPAIGAELDSAINNKDKGELQAIYDKYKDLISDKDARRALGYINSEDDYGSFDSKSSMAKMYTDGLSGDNKNRFNAEMQDWYIKSAQDNKKPPSPDKVKEAMDFLISNRDGWDVGQEYKEDDAVANTLKHMSVNRVAAFNGDMSDEGIAQASIVSAEFKKKHGHYPNKWELQSAQQARAKNTDRHIVIKDDEGSYLKIPTVYKGQQLSDKEAIDRYKLTGDYAESFDNLDEALVSAGLIEEGQRQTGEAEDADTPSQDTTPDAPPELSTEVKDSDEKLLSEAEIKPATSISDKYLKPVGDQLYDKALVPSATASRALTNQVIDSIDAYGGLGKDLWQRFTGYIDKTKERKDKGKIKDFFNGSPTVGGAIAIGQSSSTTEKQKEIARAYLRSAL